MLKKTAAQALSGIVLTCSFIGWVSCSFEAVAQAPNVPNPTLGPTTKIGVTGLLVGQGVGTAIRAGVPNTDYVTPAGSGAGLTGFQGALPSATPAAGSLLAVLTGGNVSAALWGVLPGNSGATNLTNLQAAVNAGVPKIVLGVGAYHFNGTLTVNTAGSFELEGQGQFFGTNIVQDNVSADFIDFGDGSNYRKGLFLHDFDIAGPSGQTAGYFLKTNYTYEPNVQRVSVTYCAGIDTLDTAGAVFEDISGFVTCAAAGRGIAARGTYPTPANKLAGNMFLNRVNFVSLTGSSTASGAAAVGLYVDHFDGIEAHDSQFNLFNINLEFAPPSGITTSTAGANFAHFFGTSDSFDSGVTANVSFDSNANVQSVKCVGCYFDTSQGTGIVYGSGSYNGIELDNPEIVANAGPGIYATNSSSAANVTVMGGTIAGNGSGGTAGMLFGPGTAVGWTVIGTHNGTTENYGATQTYALGVTAGGGQVAFANVILANNNFVGNMTGPIDPNFFTSGFSGSRVISGNVGFVDRSSGQPTIPAGQTSVTVTHGLSTTPGYGDISVTPVGGLGGAVSYYFSNITATTFQIMLTSPPTSAVGFAWQATLH